MATVVKSQPLFNTRNVQSKHGFKPIYYFSRALGLWPFTIDSNGSIKKAHVRLVDILWFSMSICLYLLAAYQTYNEYRTDNDFKRLRNAEFISFSMYNVFEIVSLLLSACAMA